MLFDENSRRLPTVDEVDAELSKRQAAASGGGQGIALLVFSTVLFVGAQQTFGDAPLTFIGLLALVLVLHELGHLAAMRAFGFSDLRMFFIPFFGAAASGKKPDATGTQRAVVLLAGPLSGLILGAGLLFGFILTGAEIGPRMYEFMGLLLVLNFFNLLPLLPFDGGRFVNVVLFSRWPAAEKLFRVAAGGGLIWLAVHLGNWLLGVIGGFVLLGAGIAARSGRLGQVLRARVPAPRPVSVLDTPPELRARFIEELAPTLTAHSKDHATNVRIYAGTLSAAWERAIDAPPGPVASALLLAVYLVFAGAGVVLYMQGGVNT